MTSLPFSLNIFKQIEYFQVIERLDEQFEQMKKDWIDGGYLNNGLSDEVNINYPTWEIEKKILLWTSRHHKHLGSPLSSGSLSDKLNDLHISQTEIDFSSRNVILKNLVVRGLGNPDGDGGTVISQVGLEYGLLISQLYGLEKENSIKEGDVKYRDEMLVRNEFVFFGYKLMYCVGVLVIILSLLLLGASVFEKLNISITIVPVQFIATIKIILGIISFLPVSLFVTGLYLINNK
jgi:hypothetical protein